MLTKKERETVEEEGGIGYTCRGYQSLEKEVPDRGKEGAAWGVKRRKDMNRRRRGRGHDARVCTKGGAHPTKR